MLCGAMRLAAIGPAFLLVGCFHGSTGDSPADTSTDDSDSSAPDSDTGVLVTASARLSTAIPTVIRVDWDAEGEAWVEYGPTDSYGQTAPPRPDAPQRALLLGIPESTAVHFRVAVRSGGVVSYSEDQSITTGQLELSATIRNAAIDDLGAPFGEYVMFYAAPMTGEDLGAQVIFNRDRQPVWAGILRSDLVSAARPSRDGTAFVYQHATNLTDASGAQICRYDLDGESESCLDTPWCHHDFVELPDGRYACVRTVSEIWDGETLATDTITLWSPDGSSEEIWNALDEIVPDNLDEVDRNLLGLDWNHGNGLWWDEPTDTYYLSLAHQESIHKIPRATGESEWVLGGDDSTFAVADPFGLLHGPQAIEGGMMLFDNSSDAEGGSRVLSYRLDEDDWVASTDISWREPDGRTASALGDAHLLDNGYVAASFGFLGDVRVYTPEGEVVWHYAPERTTTGQVYVYDSLYGMRPD